MDLQHPALSQGVHRPWALMHVGCWAAVGGEDPSVRGCQHRARLIRPQPGRPRSKGLGAGKMKVRLFISLFLGVLYKWFHLSVT